MNVWNPMTVRTFAPAMVGWCLTLAAWLRLEEVREDRLAQQCCRCCREAWWRCWP